MTVKRALDTKSLVLCALFTALIAAGAFIQIPVPFMDYFTLQFFFVVLSGMVLGARRGALSVAIYVLLGLFGIPIFAAGGGIGYIFRPSFGYLVGFIAASFVVGLLRRRLLFSAFAGFLVTYAIGLLYKYIILNFYLHEPASWSIVLLSCFPLDMPGDLLLCFLAVFTAKRLSIVTKGRCVTC